MTALFATITLGLLAISVLCLVDTVRRLQKRVYRLEDQMAEGPFKRDFKAILDDVVAPNTKAES